MTAHRVVFRYLHCDPVERDALLGEVDMRLEWIGVLSRLGISDCPLEWTRIRAPVSLPTISSADEDSDGIYNAGLAVREMARDRTGDKRSG